MRNPGFPAWGFGFPAKGRRLALNWLCFFAPIIGAYLHMLLPEKHLRLFASSQIGFVFSPLCLIEPPRYHFTPCHSALDTESRISSLGLRISGQRPANWLCFFKSLTGTKALMAKGTKNSRQDQSYQLCASATLTLSPHYTPFSADYLSPVFCLLYSVFVHCILYHIGHSFSSKILYSDADLHRLTRLLFTTKKNNSQ